MAFLEFKNVRISGISRVQKRNEYNQDYPYF